MGQIQTKPTSCPQGQKVIVGLTVLRQSDSNPLPTFSKIISTSQRGCTTKRIQQHANPTYSEPCHFFEKIILLGGSCTIKGVLSCMKDFSCFLYLKQAAFISHTIAAFSFSFLRLLKSPDQQFSTVWYAMPTAQIFLLLYLSLQSARYWKASLILWFSVMTSP